jgi:hypothetical protein
MQRFTLFLCGLLISTSCIAAGECKVQLERDFRVSSKSLQVSSEGTGLYEIRQGGYLSIKGTEVNLNADQRASAEQYAGDVGAMASQWIEMVSTALGEIAVSLESALAEAFGEDSSAAAKAGRAVAQAKQKFERMAKSGDGVYVLSAQEYNNLGETLSEEIEEAVKDTLGSFFNELGDAIHGEEGSFEDRMEAFGQRMEAMGSELEHLGKSLAETGAVLCDQARDLHKLEREVAKEIPELAAFPLFAG